ncbi:MAG: hypothetical protein KJ043_19520 [Anaerolineae bacterium]|nr:hypothetical protein [Anaerolineae bacterium]
MPNSKPQSAPTFWEQITHMNRLLRLLLVAIIAIITTLAVSPAIDAIYLQFFFTPETRIIPSLLAMSAGVTMYVIGWLYLVGSAGQVITITRGLKWYIYISFLMIIIVLLWMTSLLLASL